MGGRVAEELVLHTMTNGAAQDIQDATGIARNMVAMFGMSDEFGMMALASRRNQYLDGGYGMDCAQDTAARMDQAVKDILDQCYQQAVEVIKASREDMDKVVAYLLEKETITGGEMVAIIEDVGFLESIPLWAVTLLGSLFIWVLSLVMILTVYSRFFKLYMATAIAPIPLASFAGQPSSSIGVAFLKSYAAICLEGCIIVLACVIFSQFASAPPAVGDASTAPATLVWNYIGELIFNMLVLVGSIKMSDRIIRELMGLG